MKEADILRVEAILCEFGLSLFCLFESPLLLLDLVLSVVEVFQSEGIEEGSAFAKLRDEAYDSSEFVNDHFADHQSETNAVGVDLVLFVFHRSEQLENFRLVAVAYP